MMQTPPPSYHVLNYLADGILILDERAVILFANDAFSQMLGYTQEELFGLNILSILSDVSTLQACMTKVSAEGKSCDEQTDFIHKNGATVHTVKSVKMIKIDGETRIFVDVRNLSEVDHLNINLRQAKDLIEQQAHELSSLLNTKNQELEEILSAIQEIIWYIDNQTLSLRYVNDAVSTVFGFTKEEFIRNGSLWQESIHPDDVLLVKSFFETLVPGSSREIRFRIRNHEGQIRWLNSRIHNHERLALFIGVTTDITDIKAQNEEIAYLAYHDTLTRLPNRASLKEQLLHRLEHPNSAPFSLLFIDLDNFKNINDTMGHEIGDEILVSISQRLCRVIDQSDFCARFGGDEFVLLLNHADAIEIGHFCNRLIESIITPLTIEGIDLFFSCSIGISLYPEDALTGDELIKYADTAMYEAKKNGKNQFVFYHSSMQRTIHDFLRIETLIREGLNQKLFELYFQPLVDSKTLKLLGFEALLRLPHPTEGFIPPDTFITVAETNGDIIRIGEEVLHQACHFILMMQQEIQNPFFVAINISAKQIRQENFAQNVLDYLSQQNIDPKYLKIELTESAVMNNIQIAANQLKILKRGGIRIALDDFGTGYSSFSHLAQLPIDTLKIDKSFILTLFEEESNRHIVHAMSNLAHLLGMKVTAEGVENSAHLDFLVENHIDTLQGFLLSEPLSKEAILNKVRESATHFTPHSALGYTI